MNVNKIKITAIAKILILILLILTGYFIWITYPKSTKPKSEQAFIPPANEKPAYKSADEITPSGNPLSGEKLNMPTLPVPTSIIPFFENINKAAKTVEKKIKNEIATTTQTTPNMPPSNTGSSNSTSTSTEIILSLTDKEFHYLYPDAFIKNLVGAQNFFVKNIDPSYEPLLKIETDSQVRFVEEKIVAALVSTNMFTKEEGDRAIITIRFTLPKLQLIELNNRMFSFSNQYFNFTPFTQSNPKKLFLSGLLEKFYSAFIPKAEAGYCGYCYNLPECYQIGSFSPVPGYNIFASFCYCTGCYYGLGCLDMCRGGSAIYDLTTFICGCGY